MICLDRQKQRERMLTSGEQTVDHTNGLNS